MGAARRSPSRARSGLGVDVIEAGFNSSPADYSAVQTIAPEIPRLHHRRAGRCHAADIDACAGALQHARAPPRIHVFISTSRCITSTSWA